MTRRLLPAGSLALALLGPAAAGAAEISFDELPPVNRNDAPLREEYAHLGVHFVTTDDGSVWSGLSAGDPGGWSLEGTNGTAFVGFNGASYALRVLFDGPVREVQIDVARSAGSRAGDAFALRGYREGAMVEEVQAVLGAINAWSTLALAEEVDEVEWVGVGVARRHPFGVDNLRWTVEPEMLAVAIDVRPGSPGNRVNPFSRGVIPVAVLGAEGFDCSEVDAATLGFGPAGAPAVHAQVEDVNGDGYLDLVTHHRVEETGIGLGDSEACLAGATVDRRPLGGCDAVWTVPAHWPTPFDPRAHPGRGPR
jgi:hypothetical protein